MKRLLLGLGAVSMAWFFNGCVVKDVENEGPLMSALRINGVTYQNNESAHYHAGDTLRFEVDATDDRDLKSVSLSDYFGYSTSTNTTGMEMTTDTVPVTGASATASFTYIIPLNLGGDDKVTLTIVIADTEAASTGYVFDAIVDADSVLYTEKTGARIYNYYRDSATITAWDVINDDSVTFAEGTLPVDTACLSNGYVWRPTGTDSFFVVLQASEKLGLETRVVPAGFDYATVTEATAKAAYDANIPGYSVPVAVGDIRVCRMDKANRYVVIKITNVVITATDDNDYIEFSYKKD